jgi:arginase family enzyme
VTTIKWPGKLVIAGKGTDNVYVSFDVDSLDVMRFPAIKAACPYLLDPEDVRRAFGQKAPRSQCRTGAQVPLRFQLTLI